jgi:dihydrofolate reductase
MRVQYQTRSTLPIVEAPLDWNASLIKGDLAEGVTSLKRQHRGNLISFGCGELAYELATQGLADRIHFWANPAVGGSGDRAFHGRGSGCSSPLSRVLIQ